MPDEHRTARAGRRRQSQKQDLLLIAYHNGHAHCLLCGDHNPWSLKLRFSQEAETTVRTRVRAHHRFQGHDGIVHGGVIAALLDAAMTHCLFHQGIKAVTADLHVRFIRPIPVDATMDVSARLVSTTARVYALKSEVKCDGSVVAWGEAKFLRRRVASEDSATI